jgi:hypothetical protein
VLVDAGGLVLRLGRLAATAEGVNLELAIRCPAVLSSVAVAEHPMAFGGVDVVQLLAERDRVAGIVLRMHDPHEAASGVQVQVGIATVNRRRIPQEHAQMHLAASLAGDAVIVVARNGVNVLEVTKQGSQDGFGEVNVLLIAAVFALVQPMLMGDQGTSAHFMRELLSGTG